MRTGEQNEMKKIGIIGAMELEVETLKSKMNVVKTTKKANMEFFEGTTNSSSMVMETTAFIFPSFSTFLILTSVICMMSQSPFSVFI